MTVLRRLIKARIHTVGVERIPDAPCVFVSNHFTRFETFIVPYLLHRETGVSVRTLAHAGLFQGRFGEYLRALGAVSTGNPKKMDLILSDLVAGDRNWVIFPEGRMVKDKVLAHRPNLAWLGVGGHRRLRTGAAVVSLQAEFLRMAYAHALDNDDGPTRRKIENQFAGGRVPDLHGASVRIVPVNITYYPLRPMHNAVSRTANILFKELPPSIAEELVVEGQLLLSDSDITMHIGDPIDVRDYFGRVGGLALRSHRFDTARARSDLIVKAQRHRLTQAAMTRVYQATTVNLDHLYCGALRAMKRAHIPQIDLHRALYLSADALQRMGERNLHPGIAGRLVRMLCDPSYEPLVSIESLAAHDGTITRRGDILHVDAHAMDAPCDFHNARIHKTVSVIANELGPLPRVRRVLSRMVNLSSEALRQETAVTLIDRDRADYAAAHARCASLRGAKPYAPGKPFVLEAPDAERGVVLSHGYLSAPEEVRGIAEALHAQGWSVYCPRLPGHGAAPADLKNASWQNWLDAYMRGYAYIRNTCRRVVLGGFSTGGLLALLAAARVGYRVEGVFSINACLRLKDIRTRVVGPAMFWNDWVRRAGKDVSDREFVEHRSENPSLNYDRNYLHGVRELQRLIGVTREALPDIHVPTLIIQGLDDPIVRPISATHVFNRVRSSRKRIAWIPADRHVIVRGDTAHHVIDELGRFLLESSAGHPVAQPMLEPPNAVRQNKRLPKQ